MATIGAGNFVGVSTVKVDARRSVLSDLGMSPAVDVLDMEEKTPIANCHKFRFGRNRLIGWAYFKLNPCICLWAGF